MTANLLQAIIRDNMLSYIKDVSPHVIRELNDTDGQIYECVLHVLREKKAVTETDIKTYIQTTNFRKITQDVLLARLNYILKTDMVWQPGMIKNLHKLLLDKYISDLTNHLINKDSTRDTRMQKIAEIQKKLSSDPAEDERFYNLQDIINQWLDDVESGTVSEFIEKSIPLNNRVLREVFKEVRPVPYVIGGRPGMRKTDLLMNLLLDFTLSGKHGLYFSLEDSIETARNKYISIKHQYEKDKVNRMDFTDEEKQELLKSRTDKKHNQIWIDDRIQNLYTFRKRVDTQMQVRNYDYIAFDHLHLAQLGRGKTHEDLGLWTKEFMYVSKEYQIPVIYLSQLNRDNAKDGKMNHDMSDFKGSGNIEQDTRHATLIEGEPGDDTKTMNVCKNTFGKTFRQDVVFHAESGYLKWLGDK